MQVKWKKWDVWVANGLLPARKRSQGIFGKSKEMAKNCDFPAVFRLVGELQDVRGEVRTQEHAWPPVCMLCMQVMGIIYQPTRI